MKYFLPSLSISLLVFVSSCTVLVDDALSGIPDVDCRTATRGTECAQGRVCIDLACVPSICGDGVIYGAELCDDQNMTARDGCEADCVPSCQSDAACADDAACNGNETCAVADAMGRRSCSAGTNQADGTECSERGVVGRCAAGVCGPCGNDMVDTGEECDDDNQVEGDGCDNDCTFSCESDTECSNSDVCDGIETCDLPTHTCLGGPPPDCNDNNECSTDSCDAATGCINDTSTTDADGDGFYSSITCPSVGDDCDDTRDDRYPGAQESCTDPIDMNCDGSAGTASTPTWYVDCDRDQYAGPVTAQAPSVTRCTPPGPPPACGGGQYVTRAPTTPATTDCHDLNAAVNPGITAYSTSSYMRTNGGTSFDWNCNGMTDRQYNIDAHTAGSGYTASCGPGGGGGPFVLLCTGESWWVASSGPSCGVAATRSYCGGGFTFDPCSRRNTTTTQACR